MNQEIIKSCLAAGIEGIEMARTITPAEQWDDGCAVAAVLAALHSQPELLAEFTIGALTTHE